MFAPLFYFGVVQPASGMPVSLSKLQPFYFSCERIIVSSILKRVSAFKRAAGWRHEYGAARFAYQWLPGNRNLRFALQHLRQSIKRRGMLAQALSSSKANRVIVAAGRLISVRLTTAPS